MKNELKFHPQLTCIFCRIMNNPLIYETEGWYGVFLQGKGDVLQKKVQRKWFVDEIYLLLKL